MNGGQDRAGDQVRFPGHGESAGLDLADLTPAEERHIVRRLANGSFDDWASSAARVGYCAHPIRIRGSSTTYDRHTGEQLERFSDRG